MSPFKQVARDLHSKGLSVIPLRPKSKIPAIKDWSRYSKELPTLKDIAKWETIEDANVGVVLGEASGLIGLDFDYDIDNLHSIIKNYLGDIDTVTKKGNKGCTMLFKYNGEDTCGWSKGSDRVLDLLSNGSHTVLPPSIHPKGDVYDYESLLDIEDLDSVPELPKRFVKRVNKLFQDKEEKVKSSGDINVDIEQVREALNYIDNTGSRVDYDTWLQVGMALKDGLGDEGYELWTEWSSRSDRSTGKSWEVKWKSFKEGKGITLGSLFKLAMDNGFEFTEDKVSLEGVVKPIDLYSELEDWRTNGIDRGESTGFTNLDELIHFRKGEFTVWTGYANNGKSEVVDSVALKLMEKGWKFLYCSLEKLPKSHVQSLIHKLTGLPIQNRPKDSQRGAIEFLDKHCAMIGRNDFNPTIDNIIKMAKIYKNVYGLDAIIIDPFNYISSPHRGDIFNHTAYVLEKCTAMAQQLGISVQMVAHPKKPDKVFGNKLPRLTMYSISGNADFANMSDVMISVYRTPDNTNELEVLKVRDQDVDSTGKCEFKFDKYTKRHEPCDLTGDL